MYTADFVIASDWGVGFTANLVITNLGSEPLTWSQLSFDAPFKITNLWNGQILSETGGKYVIGNAGWNEIIPAKGQITIGFNGSKTEGSIPQITNLSLAELGSPSSGTPTPPPALPTIALTDLVQAEGNSTTTASFKVSLSAASKQPVSVQYATQNGSAIAGQDYVAANGTLTFAPGEVEKTVPVTILGDTQVEPNETFYLRLSNPANGQLAVNQATATLNNDDVSPTPTTLPTLAVNDVTISETANGAESALAKFQVTLSKASSQTVKVAYKTEAGSAIAGQDFTGKSGTLTFKPGQTQKVVSIKIIDDTVVEGSETFKLTLSNPTGATLSDGQGIATIQDNDSPPPLPTTGKFNYGEALQKSFLFYEAQRSGTLPQDNRIEWRGDSALQDGADVGMDLTEGYYDAGDHVKFGFPMAYSMTMLSWGVEEYRPAYSSIGQLDEALAAIKWGTDYLLKAHVTDAQGTKAFWGQVGDGNVDHSYWGPPEEMTMARPAFVIDRQNPGSDLAAEAAAALAAASIVFRPTDASYANKLLTNARQLYTFADTYRGKYSDSIPNAQSFYNSWSGYQDELAWGAAWLYEATGEKAYLQKAESIYQNQIGGLNPGWTINWDDKSYGVAVLLAQETGSDRYRQDVENWLNAWVDGRNGVQKTQGGLRWISQWGSLRYAANTAFVAGVYADTVRDPNGHYSDLAETTVDYLLGDNPRDASYVVGFGKNSPQQPHHRAAHGGTWSDFNDPAPNDHILYGALVGGPSEANDFAYEDKRSNYITNEVTLDYNAGYTGALVRMVDMFGGNPLNNTQLDALPGVAVHNAA